MGMLQRSAPMVAPALAAGYDGVIAVGSGTNSNKFVNGNAVPIQLRGANMSGLEFIGVQGQLPINTWAGIIPAWSVYQTWKPNVARIPLNVASFLGLTCQTAHGQPATSFSGTNVVADPQGNYVATVDAAIAAAQAIGCYVILDLHWSCPQVTLGGSTQYILPDGQPEFMNSSTDGAFWTAIANRYGTQATPQSGINNNGIIFELFNEPYIDYYASGSTLYGLMLNGGTVAEFTWAIGAYNVQPTGGVGILGYQQALNNIRTAGANNICIVNGPTFTQSTEFYTSYMPTDTLNPKQLAVGWHPYPVASTYAGEVATPYGLTGNDSGNGTSSFAQWAEAVITAGIPVIITEDGGWGNPTGGVLSPPEPHMAYMQSLADAQGMSYVFWQWNNSQGSAANTQNYACAGTNAAPTPIAGEGTQCYNWMVNHA